MSASSSDQSSAGDGNPTPAKKQKTSDSDSTISTSTQLATSIPYVTSVPVISGTTGSPALQTGALSFTISNGELHFKPVSENATTHVGIQPTSNALPGTIAMVKGLNPHNLKIPTPNQQIRTTAFVAQSPGISSSTAATFTVRPGMTLVARQGFPMQALQTAVQQAQQQQPKTLKGHTTSQVQIQPQQIQINPQTAVIQTSKVVQGHMALGQVSLTQFTQTNPTSVNQTPAQPTVQFQHKLQPQLVTKILPNQTQPIQVKQLTKSQQMQIAQCKTVTQIPLVVTQLSQNSQQMSQPKVTTTLTQSQAPVMQTWTLTQIPQGLAKGQEISKQVINPMIINPVQAKLQPQASSLPKVLSPISPQTKNPLLTQVKPQEIQIKAQVIQDIKQAGNTTQIKLPIPSNISLKKTEPTAIKSSNPSLLPKISKEVPDKSASLATKPLSTGNVEITVKSVPAADSGGKVACEPEKDQGSVKNKEIAKADSTQSSKDSEISLSIPTVVLEETIKEQKEIKKESKEIPISTESKEVVLKENKIDSSKGGEVKTECSDMKVKTEKGDNSASENISIKKVTETESKVDSKLIKSEDDKKLKNDKEMEEKTDTSGICDSENKNELPVLVKQEVKNEKVEPNIDSENSQDSVEYKKIQQVSENKEVTNKKDESVTGDFDAVGAMDWEDGVGTLEGSDLKFKMNEFGVLEVITDELECEETLNLSSESEDNKSKGGGDADDSEPKNRKPSDIVNNAVPSSDGDKKDEVCQCENCGEYGFSSEFCNDGRYCSQGCAAEYANKQMRGIKRQSMMSIKMQGMRKKKKKFLDGEEELEDFKGTPGRRKVFDWAKYLQEEKAIAAPNKCFKEAFPSQRNGFKVGMRMEGIDPKHQSLYCVLSVAEICGYRLRLHFDGFSECYDFWTNADSPFIFPIGFCEKNGKPLQPPKGFNQASFNWTNYLKLARAVAAPKSLFSNQPVQPVTPTAFRVGSKLEAVDKKNNNLICVATVIDTMGDKVLIHFDGWEDTYDYWCDITSPNIHHVNWCHDNGIQLSLPNDWKEGSPFNWEVFLNKRKTTAVPARAFKPRSPVGFETGVKLEVVDKRNPILVRVATICETMNHLIKIHFDGWSVSYDYWLDDDSPDIHPPGWCNKTGHPLTPPIDIADLVVAPGQSGCPTPGCKGIGHIKGAKYIGHHSHFGCPYSSANMNKETTLQDRLGSTRAEECNQTPSPSPTGIGSTKTFKNLEQGSTPTEEKNIKFTSVNETMERQNSASTPSSTPPPTPPSKTKLTNGEVPKVRTKSTRGRKPRSYYLNMGDRLPPKPLPGKPHKDKDKDKGNLHNGIHQSVFMSAMVSNPNKDLPLCWDQHSKLLPGVDRIGGNDVTKWTIDQVTNFVKTLPGCEEQAKVFKEEQIDGEAFLLMTQTDIVKIMNIKLGPALKIYNSILMFKNSIDV